MPGWMGQPILPHCSWFRFVNDNETLENFSAAKSNLKQAKVKINVMFCLHNREQKLCLGETMLITLLMVFCG